jgi:hypothetical protein
MKINNGNLLLSHSTSLSFWIRLDSVDKTGTLFSKIQEFPSYPERVKINVVAGNWNLQFEENETAAPTYSVTTTGTTNDDWNLLTFVIKATGGHSSTLSIYKG